VKTILNSTRNLSQYPLAGRVVPELDHEGVGELFAYSYRVIYRFENEVVIIAAVVHGRRMLNLE